MSYKYPFEKDLSVRSKYSVSQLNSKGHKSIESLKEPDFMIGQQSITAAMRGTIYHAVLQHMDIAKAYKEGLPYVEKLLKSMVEKEILSIDEVQIIDKKIITSFVESDIATRISASPGVYKETRFNLLTEQDGNQVIVRGIIDCFFEEGDNLVLLDYKTGSLKDVKSGNIDAIKDRYKVQIDLYRDALEKATGKTVKEAYLYLTDAGEFIQI